MSAALRELLARHKRGEQVGITSVCSAHPLVIEAALRQARDDGTLALIEATSNQVDQFGGYTGMRPADFRDLVYSMAGALELPPERIVLGGDHLGPNTWRAKPADEAMALADELVAAYAAAGYTKIHLDCSMACADDRMPLTDEVVAARSARLARSAEAAAPTGDIVYVIGTEVPVPGGAHEHIDALAPTEPDAARATLDAHRDAFADAGLEGVWDACRRARRPAGRGVRRRARLRLRPERARRRCRRSPTTSRDLVFEAHSTDYQLRERLGDLVRDHWAILKVGPGLTFALREALFALAAIEDELVAPAERSDLVETVERVMVARPKWWAGYYTGDDAAQRIARRYSYSDRLRYYWPDDEISAAQQLLLDNLRRVTVPLPMISAVLPDQYARIRRGQLEPDPTAIAIDRVRDVLRDYAAACTPQRSTS